MSNINIKELLGREAIFSFPTEGSSYYTDKTIMVTGGGGSVGSELCRQISKCKPYKLIILDLYENNAYNIQRELMHLYPDMLLEVIIASVGDKDRMDDVFAKHLPQIVFHAAAHKHIPLMEENPSAAIINNFYGTLNVAEHSVKYGVKRFMLISSDKAVNPTSVMGATKKLCEIIMKYVGCAGETAFAAVRFGNVLNSNGSVLPLFKKQIERGGPITLTHREVTRYLMTIEEAAHLVLEATTLIEGGEIFVLDIGKPVKIYDLAVKLISSYGLSLTEDIDIKIIGLRPGEKLHEEMLARTELQIPTENKHIFIAKAPNSDVVKLNEEMDRLLDILETYDSEQIRKYLLKLANTY